MLATQDLPIPIASDGLQRTSLYYSDSKTNISFTLQIHPLGALGCIIMHNINLLHSCVHCKHPRSKDPRHVYCTHCGSRFPPLPKTGPKPPLQMAACSSCRSHLPLDSTKCLVCEGTVLKPLPIPTIAGQVDGIHQCKVCVFQLKYLPSM